MPAETDASPSPDPWAGIKVIAFVGVLIVLGTVPESRNINWWLEIPKRILSSGDQPEAAPDSGGNPRNIQPFDYDSSEDPAVDDQPDVPANEPDVSTEVAEGVCEAQGGSWNGTSCRYPIEVSEPEPDYDSDAIYEDVMDRQCEDLGYYAGYDKYLKKCIGS